MKTKKSSGAWRLSNIMPWVLYGVIALVFALLQMAPNGFPLSSLARPTPLVVFVVCVAMLEGPTIGSVMGIVAGLLWNLYSPRLFGYYGLLLMVIGVTVGLLVQWLLRANFPSAMLLCFGAMFVYTLLDWTLCYVLFMDGEMWTVLGKVYLPNALYTIVISPLMYWLILWIARLLRRKNRA